MSPDTALTLQQNKVFQPCLSPVETSGAVFVEIKKTKYTQSRNLLLTVLKLTSREFTRTHRFEPFSTLNSRVLRLVELLRLGEIKTAQHRRSDRQARDKTAAATWRRSCGIMVHSGGPLLNLAAAAVPSAKKSISGGNGASPSRELKKLFYVMDARVLQGSRKQRQKIPATLKRMVHANTPNGRVSQIVRGHGGFQQVRRTIGNRSKTVTGATKNAEGSICRKVAG